MPIQVNEVEGQTTIISIKAEGTPIKKGELVAELDSATLRDNLTNQDPGNAYSYHPETQGVVTSPQLYDTLGRFYHIGFRINR